MENNKTRMLENGMSIIDLGYRKETPIALVKRDIDYKGKKEYEYIVAFNYEIINNKIEWDYGYYYGTDILKAKKDFQTVVNGGNLENTFDNNILDSYDMSCRFFYIYWNIDSIWDRTLLDAPLWKDYL